MDNHIARVGRVREDRVGLDDLLRKAVVHALEQERAETGSGTAGNRVQQHEALEGIASVRFPVNHLHDLLVHRLAGLVSITPVVAGTYTALSNEEVFRVVDVLVRAGLDAVYDAWLEIDQDGSGDISGIVTLVEEDVLAVAALARKVLEVAILVDAVFLAKLLPELAADCAVDGTSSAHRRHAEPPWLGAVGW